MMWQSPHFHARSAWFLSRHHVILWPELSPFPHRTVVIPPSTTSLFSSTGLVSCTYLKPIILHGSAKLYHLHRSLLFLLNSFSSDILNTCWRVPPCCFISIHLTNKPGGSTIAKYCLGTRDSAVNKAASHGVYVPTGAPASRVHIWILSSFTTVTVLVFFSMSMKEQCNFTAV